MKQPDALRFAPDGGHYRREPDGTLTCLDPATGPAPAKPAQAAQDAPQAPAEPDPDTLEAKARARAPKPRR
jgi:hypothetical protein